MSNFKKEYAENGFCIVKNLLPAEMAETALNDFHRLIKLQLKRFQPEMSNDLYTNMQSLLRTDVSAYLAALRRGAKLASITKYLTHPNLIDATAMLGIELPTISAEPVLHVNADKLRIPGGYYGFETHQDWPSIQGSLDCIVAWAPLMEVTKRNFPMELIPKSHEKGLYQGEITANVYKIAEGSYDEKNFVPAVVSPGDAVFMSCWTLHRTGVEGSEGLRISVSNRWENAMEPSFVERNYPCAYKQSVQRELITPDFPSLDQVQKVFKNLEG